MGRVSRHAGWAHRFASADVANVHLRPVCGRTSPFGGPSSSGAGHREIEPQRLVRRRTGERPPGRTPADFN